MSRNEPKKQHYVPQFLLRNFALGKKKRVHVYDLKAGKSFVSHVRDIGHENNFYHHPYNGNEMEHALSELEAEVAPIIDGVLATSSIAHLSEEDQGILARFTIIQMMRVNAFREDLTEISDLILERFSDEDVVRGSQADKLLQEIASNNSKQSSIDMLWNLPEQLLPHLLDKHLSLQQAPKGSSFYISDNPIVKYNYFPQEYRGNLGLALKGIEVHFPISPKYCLSYLCSEVVQDVRKSVERHHLAVVMNGEQVQDQTEALRLLNQIDTQKTQLLSKENMEHHNSLQVLYCSRFIYSSRDDFSLLKTMLADNPSLANKRRVSNGSHIF
ncbi:DUF4238 domain-containing protein [Vibrio parahaemolyticus]